MATIEKVIDPRVFSLIIHKAVRSFTWIWSNLFLFLLQKDIESKVGKDKELKHLGFVRIAAIQTLVCVSNLYEYAKHNSGPLRSTVGTVECAVTTVVGPVYEKLKGVPDDLLAFLDTKVFIFFFEKKIWSFLDPEMNGIRLERAVKLFYFTGICLNACY